MGEEPLSEASKTGRAARDLSAVKSLTVGAGSRSGKGRRAHGPGPRGNTGQWGLRSPPVSLTATRGAIIVEVRGLMQGRTSLKELPTVMSGKGPRFVRHSGIGMRLSNDQTADLLVTEAPNRNATILLAGDHFAVGSPHGTGAMGLMACGIKAVIAPSFAPEFPGSCLTFGLLPVTLPEEVIEELAEGMAANPEEKVTIDLEEQVIEFAGLEPISFSSETRAREKLLQGLSDLDEMLQLRENVSAFRNQDRTRRPWVYKLQNRDEGPPPTTPPGEGIEGEGQGV